MNRLQDNDYSSPGIDIHVQPSFDHIQNLQLYRKLVENVLVPNSNMVFNSTSHPTSPLDPPALFGLGHSGYSNDSHLSTVDMSSLNSESHFYDCMDVSNSNHSAGGSQTSEYTSTFQGLEPWSPCTTSSELDFQTARGIYPSSTSASTNSESTENSDSMFNFMAPMDTKSKEDRKLARRRERNRTSQRAFRARKEKYTQDLERHYMDLRQRYETLVDLLRRVTGFEAENYLLQNHLDGKLMSAPKAVEV